MRKFLSVRQKEKERLKNKFKAFKVLEDELDDKTLFSLEYEKKRFSIEIISDYYFFVAENKEREITFMMKASRDDMKLTEFVKICEEVFDEIIKNKVNE